MGTSIRLWILALLSQPALIISDPHYLVAFPAIIDHPNEGSFCVLLRSLQETNHLSVTLEMATQNHTLVEKDVAAPGTFECLSFQVPAFIPTGTGELYGEETLANVHILIQKGSTVAFDARKKVLLVKANVGYIVQPSKSVYKPGDTIRIRIVRLDDKFKAIDKIVPLIELKDPNQNRIAQWVDAKPLHGIVDLSFPLASEAPLGEYSFHVQDKELGSGFGNLNVEEYELPKFEIFIKYPALITISDETFQLSICGKYTYGKPVQGSVNTTLERSSPLRYRLSTNTSLPDISKEYIGKTDKTGCATFTINATDINLFEQDYGHLISLSAMLEEEGTGLQVKKSDNMFVATNQMRVSFGQLNAFYKKGVPYSGTVSVTLIGSPVKNVTIYLTVDVDDVLTHIALVTDEYGVASFTLDTTDWNATMVSLKAKHTVKNQSESGDAEDYRWLKPFYSESNSFLEIQHVKEELPCGKDVEVLVDYTLDRKELDPEADHIDFYYLVVSNGKIISNGQKKVLVSHDETLKGKFSLVLTTNPDLAPIARLLLFAVFADGEVAADVEMFTVDKCFKHKVKVKFSSKQELPGSKVSLQIDAAPGAFCSVQSVDKRLLLWDNNTLTASKVYSAVKPYLWYDDTVGGRGFHYRLEDFEPYPCLPPLGPGQKKNQHSRVAPWYQSEADVYSLFKQLKLKLLTNTKVKKPVSCDLPRPERILFKGDWRRGVTAVEHTAASQDVSDSESKHDKKAKPRTKFPEIWIWDLVPVNEEGKAVHSLTVPDSITEWEANAFCLADTGFGLSTSTPLRVFQPFFVDLILPYSVIRGETFQIKATIFNYLKKCIQVRVNLLGSEEVEVKPCLACQFTTCLCEDEAKTFSWNVTAIQLGHVNVSVSSEAENTHELCGNKISVTPSHGQSDTVIKSLLVKPEGVLEEKTQNMFLCSTGQPAFEDVSLKLPEAVVKDSGRAIISAIGDVMGAALENIDKLLQMPVGCGEQNMVKFVPNIVILQYLEKTNQATPEIKEKALEHMKSGYQRELLYKHDDGSYSAFGKADEEGNTWLTAFVAKAFGQLKSYVYVDEKHIQDAVHWLKKHQLPSGCFENVGRLFNNALKGSVDDDLSLTAYVTASLLELHLEENGTVVEDALLCLKRNLSSVVSTYPKALLAYVFTLAGDTEIRKQLLKDLDEQAVKEEGTVFFPETETMAYVLLARLSMPDVAKEDVSYASQMVGNLNRKRNANGGFISTQDTVIGLQSLARYAALTYIEIENIKVVVKSDEGFQHEFHVDKKNRLLLQQASLPNIPGQYRVELSGNGCAYVQTILRYNKEPPQSDAFALKVEISPQKCTQASRKSFEIQIAVSYTGRRETSNMALLQVNMISGYVPVKQSVKKLLEKPLVKKVEFDPDKISIYLDQLDNHDQRYTFFVEQEIEVWDLKAAIVKVYDYYHPEDNKIAEYNAPCSAETTKEDHN